jgi:hypothetical protein
MRSFEPMRGIVHMSELDSVPAERAGRYRVCHIIHLTSSAIDLLPFHFRHYLFRRLLNAKLRARITEPHPDPTVAKVRSADHATRNRHPRVHPSRYASRHGALNALASCGLYGSRTRISGASSVSSRHAFTARSPMCLAPTTNVSSRITALHAFRFPALPRPVAASFEVRAHKRSVAAMYAFEARHSVLFPLLSKRAFASVFVD